MFILILNSCDYPCVSSTDFGNKNIVVKRSEIFANPYQNDYTNRHLFSDNGCERYWHNLNEKYDNRYEYTVKIEGAVTFCDGREYVHSSDKKAEFHAATLQEFHDVHNEKVGSWSDKNNDVAGNRGLTQSSNDDYKPRIRYYQEDVSETGVFLSNPALYFDGINDHLIEEYNANYTNYSLSAILSKDKYALFLVFKPEETDKGMTILYKKDSFRLYIDGSDLKINVNNVDEEVGTVNYEAGNSYVKIWKSGGKINIKLNQEPEIEITSPSLSNGWDDNKKISIGANADDNTSSPYKGYIGYIVAYEDAADDDVLYKIQAYIENNWIKRCIAGEYRDNLRIRIGVASDENIFVNNVFVIPESLKENVGNEIYIRYQDPHDQSCGYATNNDVKKYYEDNTGKIDFILAKEADSGFIGRIYDALIKPLENYVIGQEETIYTNVMRSGGVFFGIGRIALCFYIVTITIAYMFGLTKFNQVDFIIRSIKLAIIIALISPNNWVFFNNYVIGFFRNGVLDLASNITQYAGLNSDVAEDVVTKKLFFDDLDAILGMFISSDINAKILSLAFYPVGKGFLMVLMFYYAIYNFIHIMANVIIIYITIFLMMSLAFLVAPLFIIFALFQVTRPLFNKWLDLLISYFIQYIFLASVVAIFSTIIFALFKDLMNFSVCWRPIFICCKNAEFSFTLLEFFKPVIFDYGRFNSASGDQYIPDFWEVALFLFFVVFFREFCNFVVFLATRISDGVSVASIAANIGKEIGTNNMYKSATNTIDRNANRLGEAISGAHRMVAPLYGGQVIRNPYRSMKEFMHKNKFGGIDRIGIPDESRANKINTIKDAIHKGRMKALTNGKDLNQEVENSVRSALEKEGMSTDNINKVIASRQMRADLKGTAGGIYSSDEVKLVLTTAFDKKFQAEHAQGKTEEAAREAANEAVDKAKKNIAKTLSTHKQRYGDGKEYVGSKEKYEKILAEQKSKAARVVKNLKTAFDKKFQAKHAQGKTEEAAREAANEAVDKAKKNIAKTLSTHKQRYEKILAEQKSKAARVAENLKDDFKTRNSELYDKSTYDNLTRPIKEISKTANKTLLELNKFYNYFNAERDSLKNEIEKLNYNDKESINKISNNTLNIPDRNPKEVKIENDEAKNLDKNTRDLDIQNIVVDELDMKENEGEKEKDDKE